MIYILYISKRESPCSKGTCTSIPGVGFMCSCEPGYSGRFCNVQIDYCTPSPCKNNGVCIIGNNGYTCSCNLQFTGKNCEVQINYCGSSPCLNGATCSLATTFAGYICTCPYQFTGFDWKNLWINQIKSLIFVFSRYKLW